MSKTLWYCVGLGAVVLFSAAGIAIATDVAAASAPATETGVTITPGVSPTGLPLNKPVLKPTPYPLLKRDQLVTRGRADDKLEIEAVMLAYTFFHDTHNGEGIASLFVKGGSFEHLYNNGGKTLEPFPGPVGRGCLKSAPDDLLKMYNNAAAFPAQSHNQVTNMIVQVYGDTATLYANVTRVLSNSPTETPAPKPYTATISHSMQNVADLQRTPEGWRFSHLRIIQDFKPAEANSHPPCPAATN